MLTDILGKLEAKKSLSEEEMISSMKEVMTGKIPEADIVRFLTLLRDKGESYEEVLGAARVLRECAVKVNVNSDNLVDTCGTGGDAKGTFNFSTAAAFVAAGADVRIAKHGNRAVSSQAGSADVLEKLGVRIELEPVQVRQCLQEAGFGFFFAPKFHPAMKNVAGARKKIGTRTLFNLLGPLLNPAGALFQVIGVFNREKMPLLARVLKELGSKHVMLVHGEDGLDEITLTGKTFYLELREGKVSEGEIHPQDLGFSLGQLEDLQGRDADYNAFLMKGLLEGYESPLRHAVILNSAAALYVAGRARTLEEGVTLSEHSLDHGKALQVLKNLIRVSNM